MDLINTFDAPIYKFNSINSTNLYAKDLCKKNPKSGTIIISDKQTNGYGRFGNSWESSKNNGLYYSIIFEKSYKNSNYETLPLFVSLAITELLNDYEIISKIKWPNDIMIDDKKVCGILCEKTSNCFGEFIIVGIGINLYHNIEDFPKDLKSKATSLKLHTSNPIIKSYFTNSLTNYLFKYYNYFNFKSFKDFLDEYKTKSYLLNKQVSIKLNNKLNDGIVQDFNENGHIVLKINNELVSINSGEISLKNIYK